jgi:hypothetical protein
MVFENETKAHNLNTIEGGDPESAAAKIRPICATCRTSKNATDAGAGPDKTRHPVVTDSLWTPY